MQWPKLRVLNISIKIQVQVNVIMMNKKTLTQNQNNFTQVCCILHRGCDFFIVGLTYWIGVRFLSATV